MRGSLQSREQGDPVVARRVDDARPGWFAGWQVGWWRAARGTLRRQALDERPREVRRPRSTCEAAEQARLARGGGGGGKGAGQGERGQQNASRTQSRARRAQCAGSRAPDRATEDKERRFTALLHHVDVDRLRAAYARFEPAGRARVDGVTWHEPTGRIWRPTFGICTAGPSRRAIGPKPTRRAYIPKPDGRLRPLGIAALEDKILQRAVVEVLNGIYEADFLGFSYGFRPGRSRMTRWTRSRSGSIRRR